jgi:hypothetical protein
MHKVLRRSYVINWYTYLQYLLYFLLAAAAVQCTCSRDPSGEGFAFNNFLYKAIQRQSWITERKVKVWLVGRDTSQEPPASQSRVSPDELLTILQESIAADSSGMLFWETARSHRYADQMSDVDILWNSYVRGGTCPDWRPSFEGERGSTRMQSPGMERQTFQPSENHLSED